MMIPDEALNLEDWIDENRDELKPPVGNKKIYHDSNFIVMAIGGPNARKDFHIDPDEEFFYQVEGDMTLEIMEDGEHKEIPIREGEIYLLPSNVPHSPQRPEGTIGIVIEHQRDEGDEDGLRWYCDSCGEILHEETFELEDIETQIGSALDSFWSSDDKRTCSECGHYLERD
jgi:3-hydroxyanthranilate 3,4-dioxygenase